MARYVTLNPNNYRENNNCRFFGARTAIREIHLKLSGNAYGAEVRVYTDGRRSAVEFSNVLVGPTTISKARCQPYQIINKWEISEHGLIYFANYDGEFGFHSKYHKVGNSIADVELIGGEYSAGCARMNDDHLPVLRTRGSAIVAHDARNRGLDSFKLYDMISVGDLVRVYSVNDEDNRWYAPSFQRVGRSRRG